MSDMKHVSTKRLVQQEEHAITVSAKEIVDMLIADDPERVCDSRDLALQITIPAGEGKKMAFGASQLLDLIRTHNATVPEDAEVVIAVRWCQETEVKGNVQNASIPTMRAAANMAQVAQQVGADPALAVACSTCGGLPVFQGPTPDCQDQAGCGAVRARYGNMPIAQSAPAQPGQGMVGNGGSGAPMGVPKGQAINRETGEKAFIAKDGGLYGRHEYIKDRLSAKDI